MQPRSCADQHGECTGVCRVCDRPAGNPAAQHMAVQAGGSTCKGGQLHMHRAGPAQRTAAQALGGADA